MSRPRDLPPGRVELAVIRSDDDKSGAFWPWDVSQAWSDELGDERQDLYTLADGQPADASRCDLPRDDAHLLCSKLEVAGMDRQMLSPNREPAAIWARLMQMPGDELSPAAAEYLLSIRFAESDVDRMRYLAERSETGELTDEEHAEFDSYLHVGNLLAVIQSKARVALRRR